MGSDMAMGPSGLGLAMGPSALGLSKLIEIIVDGLALSG